MRASSTRATGFRRPDCTQIDGNDCCGVIPLSGWLKISQFSSWPRPPSPMLPVATPPSGKEIILRCAPVNTRGYFTPRLEVLSDSAGEETRAERVVEL